MPPWNLSLHVDLAGCDVSLHVPLRRRSSGKEESSQEPAPACVDADLPALLKALQADGTGERLRAGGEHLDLNSLARWVKAKKNNLRDAEDALKTHSYWRQTYVPRGRISEGEVAHELAAGKAFLQGCDAEGRAVLVVLARKHDMKTRDIRETERFICYVLDNASALAEKHAEGNGQIQVLFDLSGLRMRNLDVKGLGAIFDVLQGHYPERLSSLLFLNAPFIFWGVWRVVGPFINPTTRSKIQFISLASDRTRLLQSVPREVLPECYGGNADLIPLEKSVNSDNFKAAISNSKLVDIDEHNGLARLLVWRRITSVGDKFMVRGWKVGHRFIRHALQNLGTNIRSGVKVLRTRVLRQKVGVHGQVPFRLFPKKKHVPYVQQRAPVSRVVVKVIVAELVLLAFAGARSVVFKHWL